MSFRSGTRFTNQPEPKDTSLPQWLQVSTSIFLLFIEGTLLFLLWVSRAFGESVLFGAVSLDFPDMFFILNVVNFTVRLGIPQPVPGTILVPNLNGC